MENLRRVLLWEVIRYAPHLIFSFNCLSKSMQASLSDDPAYIYYFLEDLFSQENIRSLNWNQACDLVRELLPTSERYVTFFRSNTLKRYDIRTQEL